MKLSSRGKCTKGPFWRVALFSSCLVIFNETFAKLGIGKMGKGERSSYSAIWHEVVAVRNAEEIACAVHALLYMCQQRYENSNRVV